MADSITTELVSTATITTSKEYYFENFPLVKRLYEAGRNPWLMHVDIDIDTSTNTIAETTDMANIPLNWTTGQQIYIRSSEAADTSKTISVLGQTKAGVFGWTTLTSDATDGTTAVDCGLWYFIMAVKKIDTWAGNAIIDNNGESGEVYWTCALGATSGLGIVVIPDGYTGGLISGVVALNAEPGNDNYGMTFVMDEFSAYLSRASSRESIDSHELSTPFVEHTRLSVTHEYDTQVTASLVHMLIVLWE